MLKQLRFVVPLALAVSCARAFNGVIAPTRRGLAPLWSTTIDRPTPTVRKRVEEKATGGGKHQLLLFDDPVNTREYVSKILCTKVDLSETDAYSVMMTAHQNGLAVVGTYLLEQAESYCEAMKQNGLNAAVKPVDGGPAE